MILFRWRSDLETRTSLTFHSAGPKKKNNKKKKSAAKGKTNGDVVKIQELEKEENVQDDEADHTAEEADSPTVVRLHLTIPAALRRSDMRNRTQQKMMDPSN